MEPITINKLLFKITNKIELPKYNLEILFGEHEDKKYLIYSSVGVTEKDEKKHFKGFYQLMKMIQKSNINTPKLFTVDKKKHYIVQETIDGVNVLNVLSNNDIPEDIYEQLFKMYQYAKAIGINLDYDPTNFVIKDGLLYYVSYIFKPFNDQENLVQSAIIYWVFSIEATQLMQKHGLKYDRKRLKSVNEVNKEIVLLVYKHYQS